MRDKVIERFLNNPASFQFSRIESILAHLGFQKTQGKGSHVKFDHQDLKETFIIPVHNNDCKKGYKFKIAKLIKNLRFKS